MEPREPMLQNLFPRTEGRFEVVPHSLKYSTIGQGNTEGMRVLEIGLGNNGQNQKVVIAFPEGQDPIPYVKRAVEFVQSGQTQGIISIEAGEENGR